MRHLLSSHGSPLVRYPSPPPEYVRVLAFLIKQDLESGSSISLDESRDLELEMDRIASLFKRKRPLKDGSSVSPVSIQERGAFTPVASPRKSARVQLEDDYVKVDQAEEEEGMQSPRYKCLNCKKATCALSPTKGTTQDHAHRVTWERRLSLNPQSTVRLLIP